jgi:anaerobic magnesium-protoporphyrin IX monomethyl ester cyclase
MNFLLINAHASIEAITPTHKEKTTKNPWAQPLGLLYIAGVLEHEGHHVEIIDLVAEDITEAIIQKSIPGVDAVGISVDSFAYHDVVDITKRIKQIDKTIPIIIGGPHCTYYPEKSLIDIPYADISVEGEGEQVIKGIINALKGKKDLSEIAGVRYRNGKKIVVGEPPNIITDLDAIPFPARHLVNKYDYGRFGKNYLYKPKFTSIATTRGCPFQCRFCTRHIVGMNNFRQRSVGNIISELKQINGEYGSVMMVDDNFLTDKKRVNDIMDRIISEGIDIDIIVQGARVDTADEELYKKMKKAGVKAINFGIESGNQDVLDYYNKGITLDQARNAVKLSHKMGFLTVGNFIIGAPIETKDHIQRTVRFAYSLPLDLVSFTILRYNYHSDLWNEACDAGKISLEDGYSIPADSLKGLGNLRYEELELLQKKSLKNFYLRPQYLLRQFFRSIKTNDFSLFQMLYYGRTQL